LLANDHFAEMRSFLDVLVGGWGVVKGKHAIDHLMKLASGDGAVHGFFAYPPETSTPFRGDMQKKP
jgi:hypothetical protein